MNSTAVLDSAAHSHHDLHLVVLAGLICLFACYTALTLLGNARELTSQSRRWLWCAAAALVAGCGVWATHFVAMLAWRPGFQTEYDINLTLWSFALAVAGAWAGIALVLTGKLAERTGATVGGAVIGAATVVMHYTGMAAIRMPAMMHQDRLAMAISIIIGIGLGAAAFRIAMRVLKNRGSRGADRRDKLTQEDSPSPRIVSRWRHADPSGVAQPGRSLCRGAAVSGRQPAGDRGAA
jgi:NO-binding membrane sensor protein with MHYT domain